MSQANIPQVSLDPDEAPEGGGGLPFANAVVILSNPKFEMFDYGAEKGGARPTFGVNYIGAETNEDYGRQYYSVGSADQWTVSPEGQLIPLNPKPDKPSIPQKNSKFMIWLTELRNAGFPKERFSGGDISVIAGTVVMMKEVAAMGIDGKPQITVSKKTGKEYPKMDVVPGIVKKLPEETKPAGKGKKGATGTKATGGTPAPKSGRTAEGDAAITGIIAKKLMDAGDTGIAKKQLTAIVMTELKTSPHRQAALFAIVDDTFVTGGPWDYNAGIITMNDKTVELVASLDE